MNKRRTISILFVLTVIVIAGSVYRSTFRLPVATTKVAGTSIDNGMRPRVVTSRDASDFDELIELITETIEPDQWTVVGSPTRILKANQLIEIEAEEAEYVLTLSLFGGNALLATQTRYFANYHGPDKDVAVPSPGYLACAMYTNGFLSGTCEVLGKSDEEVALRLDWVFDDRSTSLKTTFRCDFDATVASSGMIDCENGAKLHWKLERKAK